MYYTHVQTYYCSRQIRYIDWFWWCCTLTHPNSIMIAYFFFNFTFCALLISIANISLISHSFLSIRHGQRFYVYHFQRVRTRYFLYSTFLSSCQNSRETNNCFIRTFRPDYFKSFIAKWFQNKSDDGILFVWNLFF